MNIKKHLGRMQLVIDETQKDVHEMEGKPFNGKVVAEYHGYMSAGLVAMAETIKEILEEMEKNHDNKN